MDKQEVLPGQIYWVRTTGGLSPARCEEHTKGTTIAFLSMEAIRFWVAPESVQREATRDDVERFVEAMIERKIAEPGFRPEWPGFEVAVPHGR